LSQITRNWCHEDCPVDFIITWGFHHHPLGQCPRQSGTCIKELRTLQPSIQLPLLDSPDQSGKFSSWKPLRHLSSLPRAVPSPHPCLTPGAFSRNPCLPETCPAPACASLHVGWRPQPLWLTHATSPACGSALTPQW